MTLNRGSRKKKMELEEKTMTRRLGVEVKPESKQQRKSPLDLRQAKGSKRDTVSRKRTQWELGVDVLLHGSRSAQSMQRGGGRKAVCSLEGRKKRKA